MRLYAFTNFSPLDRSGPFVYFRGCRTPVGASFRRFQLVIARGFLDKSKRGLVPCCP